MKQNGRRSLAGLLAIALLITCAISGLALPTAADEPTPTLYFENGIITVPAHFDSSYDVLSQLKCVDSYTLDTTALQWSISDNQVRRYGTNANPYGGSLFEAITLEGSTVKTAACTTANSLSSQNKSGNWSFAHATPTITVTDGTHTATAKIRWVYDKVPVSYDFENGQKLSHSASHTLNSYITQDLEGNYALKVPTNTRIPTRAYLYTAFAPNSVYKVSYKYKNDGEGKGARKFQLDDSYQMSMTPTILGTDASATGWQTVEATITTGAAPTPNYHYSFFFDRLSGGTNYVWIDDFKIELVSSPATAITVKPESPSMYKGSAKTFTVTTTPENASAGTITWSVSDPAKASVDAEAGIVTALADSGTVEIIATSSYGLTDSTTITLLPEKVLDPAVIFESDFENGREGLSTYFAPLVKGDEYFSIVEEENNIRNHLLQILPTTGRYFAFSDRELIPGRTYKLSFRAKGDTISVYVTGGEATPAGWTAHTPNDPNAWQTFEQYLTIPYTMIHSDYRYVFALRNRTDDTVCYVDDIEFRLVDADPPAEAIEFDYTRLNMKPGKTREIKILCNPETCDLSELVWKSSDESVAYVVAGQVTAVGAGSATVTATTKNGKVATAVVTVSGNAAFIENATFEEGATDWTLTGTASAEAEKGYFYTHSLTLPIGSTATHTLKGMKSGTPYQLFVHQALPNNTAVTKVTVKNGDTVIYEGMLGKTQRWTHYVIDFTTAAVDGDCTVTFENTATAEKNIVYLDNVILAEVVSDVDPDQLLFGDFEDTLSPAWKEYVAADGTYVSVIKDPDDPTNHAMEFRSFYNTAGAEVSGYWFQGLEDTLIPGRTYKATFKIKGAGSGLDVYCWPGKFAKPATYDSIGWIHTKAAEDGTWTQFEYTWTVDPQAIHMNSYILALKNQNDTPVLMDDFELRLLPAEAPVTALEFNKEELAVAPGRTAALKLNGTPDLSDLSGVTWTSSNEQVAFVIPGQVSVPGGGLQAQVTAVGGGEAIITATANNGKTATCKVVVNADAALLQDSTLNDRTSTAWTAENGAAKQEGIGHAYTTAFHLPKGASIAQPIRGLKANARYQVYLTTSCLSYGNKNNLRVQILDENGTVLDEQASYNSTWTANKFEFATGETLSDSYTIRIVNATETAACAVVVDNVIVAEALSDADIIVSDLYWNNDPGFTGQVKPGTPLTFTVAIVNQGTEAVRANQTFDIDILVDAKKIQTLSHTGAIEPGALITITGTAAWTATQGDHMITANANASQRLLENNILNNDLSCNLRVYDDTLTAPEGALKRGFSKLTFSDDFNSVDTIDVKASGDEGYHWYVTRQYGESDQLIGRDFTVKDGVLTLHSIESAWAHSISTTDTRKPSGFTYNQGYLEARIRLPYTSQDVELLRSKVRNPGIWAFSAQTMWDAIAGVEKSPVAIETDWMEYKGTKYRNPKDMQYDSSFHVVLHHREDTDGDGVQDYWAAQGSEFFYKEGYVTSGATADDMGDWHVLGWAWSQNLIEVYLDGRLIHVKRFSEDGLPEPNASSKYDGVPVKEGTFSPLNTQYNNIILGAQDEFRMEVDYIRVWQYDGTVEPEEDVPGNTGNTSAFIGEYLTDANGIVTEPTLDNYEQILAGESAFATLTEAEQAAVNAAIGRDYRELVAEIYNTISAVDNFVAFYACAEDGTPYTLVDATNYEWIASSAAEWETFSDFARALVDVKVAEQSGMTFTDMLAQAQAYTPEAPKQDEVTTAKKKVVKTDLTVLWIVLGVVGGVIVVGGAVVAVLLFTKKKKSK